MPSWRAKAPSAVDVEKLPTMVSIEADAAPREVDVVTGRRREGRFLRWYSAMTGGWRRCSTT